MGQSKLLRYCRVVENSERAEARHQVAVLIASTAGNPGRAADPRHRGTLEPIRLMSAKSSMERKQAALVRVERRVGARPVPKKVADHHFTLPRNDPPPPVRLAYKRSTVDRASVSTRTHRSSAIWPDGVKLNGLVVRWDGFRVVVTRRQRSASRGGSTRPGHSEGRMKVSFYSWGAGEVLAVLPTS